MAQREICNYIVVRKQREPLGGQIWFGISWWKAVAGQIARSLGHEPLE